MMFKNVRLLTLMLLCAIVLNPISAQTNMSILSNYLPAPGELGIWHQVDSARIYVGEDLFVLIDGGAALYLEFGFREALAVEYQTKEATSIKVELYEMSDDGATYGMYSIAAGTRGTRIHVGDEGTLAGYYLMFHRSHFLVSLSADDTSKIIKEGLLSIATAIDKHIGVGGKKPDLLKYLPDKELLSAKYIRGLLGLSALYTFDTKNVFGVTEGIIGYYPSHTVFIFSYRSTNEAQNYYKNASDNLQTNNRFSDVKNSDRRFTMNDQKGEQLCITPYDRFIVVVIAQNGQNASSICDKVLETLVK